MANFVIVSPQVPKTEIWMEDSNTPDGVGDLDEGEVGIYVRDSDGDPQRVAYFSEDGQLHLSGLDSYGSVAWRAGGGLVEGKNGNTFIKVTHGA